MSGLAEAAASSIGRDEVRRFAYMPYSMEAALAAVVSIGRRLCPGFAIDDDNRFCYENLIRWVHGDPAMQRLDPVSRTPRAARLEAGLYIAGPTGTGKTMALRVLNAYRGIDGVRVQLGGRTIPLFWRGVLAAAVCDAYASTGSIAEYLNRHVLCLHDLGAEPNESLYMGNRMNVMRRLIEHRGDHRGLITLITSNLPLGSPLLEGRYDSRSVSRLHEMCSYFELLGRDRRKLRIEN